MLTDGIITGFLKGITVKMVSTELPKRYIINKGATILFWEDGTKTIVRRSDDDEYNKVLGFLWAYFQKTSGLSKTKANKYLSELVDEDEMKVINIIKDGEIFETLSNVAGAISDKFAEISKDLEVEENVKNKK